MLDNGTAVRSPESELFFLSGEAILSRLNYLQVNFRSSENLNRNGFLATYQAGTSVVSTNYIMSLMKYDQSKLKIKVYTNINE